MSPDRKAPEEIQDDIERMRSEMTDTLHAIERKLSPRQMMEQAMDTMRDVNPTRVMDAVRDYPVPLALIGLGLGWIAYSGIRGSSATAATGSAAEYGYGSTANAGFTTSESAQMMNTGYTEGGYESDSRYGSGTSHDRGNGGGESMGERAGRITEGVRESASRIAGQAQSRASRMARTASRQASVAADRSREMFNDHPLTAGMFALAAGAILGAVLPRTRSEDRMMGEARDQMIGQAREVGNEAMYKARRVASRAAEVASEQGSDLVRRTREAAQDEASRQNLGSMESPSGMPH